MINPKDIEGILAQLQASPKWKELEDEEERGQTLADVIQAAWEKHKAAEEQAGILEISLGTTRYSYHIEDIEAIGAYIAEYGHLPQKWSIKDEDTL